MALPKYKSGLERKVHNLLGVDDWVYEPDTFPFLQPEKKRKYTPDFKKGDTYVEVKGKLDLQTRQKMQWFKEQYPDVHLVIIFGKASNRLSKKSKTTYADWATKVGYEFYDLDSGIPDSFKKKKRKKKIV